MKTNLILLAFIAFSGTAMAQPSKNLKLQLSGKVLQMACPRLQTTSDAKCDSKAIALKETYEKVLSVDGIELVGKFLKPLAQEKIYDLFSAELNFQFPKEGLRSQSYAWGKVSSYCTASTGTTCVYLLQMKESSWVLFRYSSSVPLVFDFKTVSLK